ncbi:putative EF-hand domain-containing protein [Helianthus debilis subsp. tardiflorus]
MNKSSDYKRVFDHLDEDGNGMISPSELQRCIRLIDHDDILIEEVQVMIESLYGSEGQLGFEDFISLVESEKEEEKLEDLKKAFKMYEMDGTHCITPKSLKRMLSRLGESTSVNGDGVLSFDEFKAMML